MFLHATFPHNHSFQFPGLATLDNMSLASEAHVQAKRLQVARGPAETAHTFGAPNSLCKTSASRSQLSMVLGVPLELRE